MTSATATATGNAVERLLVTAAACLAGAAVMLYEMIAVRILQRDFGGAIDVWASEIAVCLAGLALGYTLGGRLADRFTSRRLLGCSIVAGGVTGFGIEILAAASGDALLGGPIPLRLQPLIAAAVCTMLPILCLGTVLPQAVRLQTTRLAAVGRSTGNVATWSTTGSIIGVLLPALVLFHHWGVREILYATASVTALAGVLLALPWRRTAAALIVVSLAVWTPQAGAQQRVLVDTYSAYHHIRVVDRADGVRALLFDEFPQSLMRIGNPYQGGFEYTELFHVPLVFNPPLDRVLFIGLGGGTGPKDFLARYGGVQVDVAEIDPAVVRIARKYFAVPKHDRLNIQVADGRVVLRRAGANRYGAIIVDAYASSPSGPTLPYHLATKEFFELASAKLESGGCLVYNAVGEFGNDPADTLRHLMVTLEAVFPIVYVYEAASSENTVFVAHDIDTSDDAGEEDRAWPYAPLRDHPVKPDEFADRIEHLRGIRINLPGTLEQRVRQLSPLLSAPRNGSVLTDNYAPVDISSGQR